MSQKFKLYFIRKQAYIQIDLAFVLLIFIIFIFLIFNMYSNYRDGVYYEEEFFKADLISNQICYLLISNTGIPNHWEDNISNLNVLGLRNIDSNDISSNKLNAMNSENYLNLTKFFDDGYLYNIRIESLNGSNVYLNFGYFNNDSIYNVDSLNSCYSNYNGEIVRVLVEVWN